MNTFDERKKAFETKFERDQNAEFKIRAKRNNLIAIWASEKVQPENKEEYIKEVRLSDLEKPGDDDIIDKILSDFNKNNLQIQREEIIKKLEECEITAKSETENN